MYVGRTGLNVASTRKSILEFFYCVANSVMIYLPYNSKWANFEVLFKTILKVSIYGDKMLYTHNICMDSAVPTNSIKLEAME